MAKALERRELETFPVVKTQAEKDLEEMKVRYGRLLDRYDALKRENNILGKAWLAGWVVFVFMEVIMLWQL